MNYEKNALLPFFSCRPVLKKKKNLDTKRQAQYLRRYHEEFDGSTLFCCAALFSGHQ